MPNYYYVKEGGTATVDSGRFATEKTGTWPATATEYYDSIWYILNGASPPTAPVAGDRIRVSHLHAKDHAAAISCSFAAGVIIESVDNSNCENYLPGASELNIASATASNDLTISLAEGYSKGVSYTSRDDLNLRGLFADCTLTSQQGSSTGNPINASSTGSQLIIRNSSLVKTGATAFNCILSLSAAAQVAILEDAVFQCTGTPAQAAISFSGTSGAYGSLVIANSCDFSDTDITKILSVQSGAWGFNAMLKNCIVPSGVTLLSNAFTHIAQRAIFHNCDSSNTIIQRDEFYFAGEVHTDTAVYLTNSTATTKRSLKLVSNSSAVVGIVPLSCTLTGLHQNLSSKTVTIELIQVSNSGTPTALTDSDFAVRLVTPGASSTLGVVTDTLDSDYLSPTNTYVVTSTTAWTESFTYETKQKVTISAPSTKAGPVEIIVDLYKPDTTVYVAVDVAVA